jgi:hypothetical protein
MSIDKKTFRETEIRVDGIDKFSAPVFDGEYVFLVGEVISYMFNESVLLKLDEWGSLVEERKLTKDYYAKSEIIDNNLFMFAGDIRSMPKCMIISMDDGEIQEFVITRRKGYVPGTVINVENDIIIVPNSEKAHPVLKADISNKEPVISSFEFIKDDEGYLIAAEIVDVFNDTTSTVTGKIGIENIYEQLMVFECDTLLEVFAQAAGIVKASDECDAYEYIDRYGEAGEGAYLTSPFLNFDENGILHKAEEKPREAAYLPGFDEPMEFENYESSFYGYP